MDFNVLIADDSEMMRSVLKRTLEMAKIPIGRLELVKNGAEALEKLNAHNFEVVFTDLNMPEMNGVKLVEEMKGSDSLKDTPIIVVSSEGSKERIEYLKNLGVSDYLRKPFTPESIRTTLHNALGDWENEK